MTSTRIITVIVAIICVLLALIITFFVIFPDMAMSMNVSDGGIKSMMIFFFLFALFLSFCLNALRKEEEN